jgi:hypothetical protein
MQRHSAGRDLARTPVFTHWLRQSQESVICPAFTLTVC